MTLYAGREIPYPETGQAQYTKMWRADAPEGHHPSDIWLIEYGEVRDGWYVLRRVTGWTPGGCRLYQSREQAEDVVQRLRNHMSQQDPRREWYQWK